jgi:hypothetical protein
MALSILRKPIGILALSLGFFFYSATYLLGMALTGDFRLYWLALSIAYTSLGVGLVMFSRLAWIVTLVWVVVAACVHGYFAYDALAYRFGGSLPFYWRYQSAVTMIFAMIALYLVEPHVRKAFFRAGRAGDSPPGV